jgi:transcriptional regulator GlxA family with amidase domain
LEIGFVCYPRLTPLDLIGPWEVLTRLPGATGHLIWTRAGPVQTSGGIEIGATVGFDDAPSLDVLVVPGGPGQLALMKHSLLLDYLRAAAEPADWVAGVCTGSLLLAQAGLLQGRRATTHWLARESLRLFGVDVVAQRYVVDGKFATAAGVSAGIDLALELCRRIAGEEQAQEIQLQIEYDPQPPLDAGSPDRAPAHLVERLRAGARHYR